MAKKSSNNMYFFQHGRDNLNLIYLYHNELGSLKKFRLKSCQEKKRYVAVLNWFDLTTKVTYLIYITLNVDKQLKESTKQKRNPGKFIKMGGAGWFNLFRCEGSFTFYPYLIKQAGPTEHIGSIGICPNQILKRKLAILIIVFWRKVFI